MMRELGVKIAAAFVSAVFAAVCPLRAASGGAAGAGLTLLEAPGARAAALGEAMSAVGDEVTAMAYNPAAVASLKARSMSIFYHSGFIDESFGSVTAGLPGERVAVGLTAGYYDGGTVNIFDGVRETPRRAAQDLTASLIVAVPMGRASAGGAVKYISSTLAETFSASAIAADFGARIEIGPKWSAGLAVQNLGPGLRYVSDTDPLPRLARGGLAYKPWAAWGFTVDGVYSFNDRNTVPAAGIEWSPGPVTLRAGYRVVDGIEKATIGAGFVMRSMSLDYAAGFSDELDTRHRFSLTMRWP